MIDKVKKTFQQAGDLIKEQASNLGEGAKEKSYQLFEQWAQVFPKLDALGLKMECFSITVTLNPAMEVHLKGLTADFTPDKLAEMMEVSKDSTLVTSVLKAIKTTYDLHQKTEAESPEIKVYLGKPPIE